MKGNRQSPGGDFRSAGSPALLDPERKPPQAVSICRCVGVSLCPGHDLLLLLFKFPPPLFHFLPEGHVSRASIILAFVYYLCLKGSLVLGSFS